MGDYYRVICGNYLSVLRATLDPGATADGVSDGG